MESIHAVGCPKSHRWDAHELGSFHRSPSSHSALDGENVDEVFMTVAKSIFAKNRGAGTIAGPSSHSMHFLVSATALHAVPKVLLGTDSSRERGLCSGSRGA